VIKSFFSRFWRRQLSGWIAGAMMIATSGLWSGFGESVNNTKSSPPELVTTSIGLCRGVIRVTCVVDGDTIWIDSTKIRLVDIDAPEVHDYKCANELARGIKATHRLVDLLNEGPFEVIARGDRDEDKYGRKLRSVMRDGKSLGDILVAEGLAAPWDGHHHYWC
jgi:micrococcal nuclease